VQREPGGQAHAHGSNQVCAGLQKASLQGGSAIAGIAQPVAAPVSARRGRSSLGDRYHVHPHLLGLAVLGCGAGLALKGGGGLEHARQHGDHFGTGCVDDGGMASPAQGFGDHPLGPGLAVWQ